MAKRKILKKASSLEAGRTAVCAACGESFEVVGWSHLRTHSLTRAEYMEMYDLSPDRLLSNATRVKRARRSDYRPYSQEGLHEKVSAIFRKYGDVSCPFFQKHYRQYFMQMVQIHGNWSNALAAIGMESVVARRSREWTPERVLEEIRALHQRRGDLGIRRDEEKSEKVLAWEGIRFFGSWRKAVEAAGFELLESGVRLEWSKEKILEAFKKYPKRKFIPGEMYAPLHTACKRYFGGMEEALAAAGISWEFFHEAKRWSKKEVLATLRGYKKIYGEDCVKVVIRNEPTIRFHAQRYVGSWDEALQLAKVKPIKITWTKEAVIQEIRRVLKDGRRTDSKFAKAQGGEKAYVAGTKLFGSWENAVQAAGYEHKGLVEHWSKEKIIESIRDLDAKGELKKGLDVKGRHPKLVTAAGKYFGSWIDAKIEALGDSYKHKPRDLAFFQEVAKRRGGECLSKKFISQKEKLKWRCRLGHEWDAVPNNIAQGRAWCPDCAIAKRSILKS